MITPLRPFSTLISPGSGSSPNTAEWMLMTHGQKHGGQLMAPATECSWDACRAHMATFCPELPPVLSLAVTPWVFPSRLS